MNTAESIIRHAQGAQAYRERLKPGDRVRVCVWPHKGRKGVLECQYGADVVVLLDEHFDCPWEKGVALKYWEIEGE